MREKQRGTGTAHVGTAAPGRPVERKLDSRATDAAIFESDAFESNRRHYFC